jgi:hypothetical protein
VLGSLARTIFRAYRKFRRLVAVDEKMLECRVYLCSAVDVD